MYVCMYTYVCIHIYIYIYTHTHMYIGLLLRALDGLGGKYRCRYTIIQYNILEYNACNIII